MRGKAIFAILTAAIGHASATAPPSADNPEGVVYKATLPDKPFFSAAALNGPIKGSITAQAGPYGLGVKFDVHFDNLPVYEEGGPEFTYHIHTNPVVNGNCTETLGHFDPFDATTPSPFCEPYAPEDCEVGDLSGKHSNFVWSMPYNASYIDSYASLAEGEAAFFGNLSFVVHYDNGTRLACANFEKMSQGTPYPTGDNSTSKAAPTATAATMSSTSAGVEGPNATASSPPFSGASHLSAWLTPLIVFSGVGVFFEL